MLERTFWAPLIPHQGAMCLLDVVVTFDAATLHARTTSHRRTDNPLREGGMLRALHLCEYGAQAMAVHGAVLAVTVGSMAKPGLLVALRAVKLHVPRIDTLPGTLDVYAEKLLDGGASWQYAFHIDHAGLRLAEGRAAVVVSGEI